jgi:hypothetical protein
MDANEILFEQIRSHRRGDGRNAGGAYANSERSGKAVTAACRCYIGSAAERFRSAGRPENESGMRYRSHELLPGPERRRGQKVPAVSQGGVVAFMRGLL